jgi:hypothetical protein
MEPEMFQERENRESPASCISKCHLRLDFVIRSRESAVLAAPFVEPTRGTSLASSIKNRMANQRRSIGWCFIDGLTIARQQMLRTSSTLLKSAACGRLAMAQ